MDVIHWKTKLLRKRNWLVAGFHISFIFLSIFQMHPQAHQLLFCCSNTKDKKLLWFRWIFIFQKKICKLYSLLWYLHIRIKGKKRTGMHEYVTCAERSESIASMHLALSLSVSSFCAARLWLSNKSQLGSFKRLCCFIIPFT